jgi:hypothetical protein
MSRNNVTVKAMCDCFGRGDLEAHLRTFGDDGQVTRMRHLVDSQQFALAAA